METFSERRKAQEIQFSSVAETAVPKKNYPTISLNKNVAEVEQFGKIPSENRHTFISMEKSYHIVWDIMRPSKGCSDDF